MRRYVLSPEAGLDLVQIWLYIRRNAVVEVADRVEAVIRKKLIFLAGSPGAGHWRKDLTAEGVKFYAAYSYLIIYRPHTKPLQVVVILHGRRDLDRLLQARS